MHADSIICNASTISKVHLHCNATLVWCNASTISNVSTSSLQCTIDDNLFVYEHQCAVMCTNTTPTCAQTLLPLHGGGSSSLHFIIGLYFEYEGYKTNLYV